MNTITEQRLQQALAKLPWLERSCLLLSINTDFTQQEIAEILSVTEEEVAVALLQGREQFHDAYHCLRNGKTILVVESEGLITRLLQENLGIEEYQAVPILNGEDAVQFALREIPDLIIIDMLLPGVDGYQMIRRLRERPKSAHIPIIVLSAHYSLADKVRALDLGVDSYIAKPFNTDELMAHARRHLARVQQSSLSPLTHLPGGLQLERAIDYKLRSMEPWSVLYLDLNNFKAFNDVYGFLAGNDMILLVGHICQRVVYEYGNTDDFVGHIGGDDFVIVTTPDREKVFCRHILERYKQESAVLYRKEDLERGSISGVDRKGRPYQFPLVSLSIGVVNDRLPCSQSIDEVGTLTAEAKRNAKCSSSNVYHLASQWNDSPLERSYPSSEWNGFSLVSPIENYLQQCLEKLGAKKPVAQEVPNSDR